MKDVFPENRITRSMGRAVISGVCAGLAKYFEVKALWIRVLAVIALVMAPVITLALYVAAVFLLPRGT